MNFSNFREKSVEVGKDLKLKKVSNAFREMLGAFRQWSS